MRYACLPSNSITAPCSSLLTVENCVNDVWIVVASTQPNQHIKRMKRPRRQSVTKSFHSVAHSLDIHCEFRKKTQSSTIKPQKTGEHQMSHINKIVKRTNWAIKIIIATGLFKSTNNEWKMSANTWNERVKRNSVVLFTILHFFKIQIEC